MAVAQLGGVLIGGVVVLVATAAISCGLRAASASLRAMVWTGGIAAVLAVTLAVVAGPRVTLAILPASPSSPSERSAIQRAASALPIGSRGGVDKLAVSPPVRAIAPTLGWLAMIAWGVGCALVLAHHARGLRTSRRLVRQGRPVRDPTWARVAREAKRKQGVHQEVELVVADDALVPFTIGLWRVSIVLPPVAETWTASRRLAVLEHEFAHVRRRDNLRHLAARLMLAVHWPNPLAWMATRRLACEREASCDDAVLRGGTRPSDYARDLLAIACDLTPAARGPAARGPAAAACLADDSDVRVRILAVLDEGHARGEAHARARWLAGLGLALAGALTCVRLEGVAHAQTMFATAAPASTLPATAPGRARLARSAARSHTTAIDAMPQLLAMLADDTPLTPQALGFVPPGPRFGDVPETSPGKEAAKALMVAGAAGATQLVQALDLADWRARRMAAWALGRMGERAAGRALAGRLDDEHEEVRRVAAWALGEMNAGDQLDALLARLRDPSAAVRAQVVHSLGDLRDQRAARGLRAAARDEDARVRAEVRWALREIG